MSKKSASEMEAHFWGKCIRLEGEGCWEWQAGKNSGGYGQVFFNGKMMRSHRVAYTLANSPILNGLHVMHSCDNPGCVNPAHLSLGTHLENMADRERKWRAVEPPVSIEALRAKWRDAARSYRQKNR